MGQEPIGSRRRVAGSEEPVWVRIERAHRELQAFLDGERSDSAELSGTRDLLDKLPRMLAEHFADEEAAGGLYDALRALRPSVDSQLQSLCQEHRQILQAVDQLGQQVRKLDQLGQAQCQEDCIGRIKEATGGLVRTIRRHERAESGLVSEIYYSDEGGSG